MTEGKLANLIASWSAVNKLNVHAPQLFDLTERMKPLVKDYAAKKTIITLRRLGSKYTPIAPPSGEVMELTGQAKQYNTFAKDLQLAIDLEIQKLEQV